MGVLDYPCEWLMVSPKLDEIDLRILELLQEDARITKAAIADEVDLAKSSVGHRIEKLEQAGVVDTYTAEVDPAAVSFEVTALLFLEKARFVRAETVEAQLTEVPEIQELHRVTGDVFWFAKVRAHGQEQLRALLEERLGQLEGIDVVETHLSLRVVKETQVLPIRAEDQAE